MSKNETKIRFNTLAPLEIHIDSTGELKARFVMLQLSANPSWGEELPRVGAVVERIVTIKHPLYAHAKDFLLKLTDAVAEEMGFYCVPQPETETLVDGKTLPEAMDVS